MARIDLCVDMPPGFLSKRSNWRWCGPVLVQDDASGAPGYTTLSKTNELSLVFVRREAAQEAPGPFVAGLARQSHSWRGVLAGDHQTRPGSMGSSGPAGAVSSDVAGSASGGLQDQCALCLVLIINIRSESMPLLGIILIEVKKVDDSDLLDR